MAHDAKVLIGSESSDHVAITVLARAHPRHDDYWDGNWLVTPIDVRAGGCRMRADAALRADELRSFREQLEHINARLEGEAVLESLETWLTLRVTIASGGVLNIGGEATDMPGVGNRLIFAIDGVDQSWLPQVIASLRDVEARFPVIDSP